MAESFKAQDEDGNLGFVHTINGEQRFIADEADAAEGVGATKAALISGGRAASEILTRTQAAFGDEQAQAEINAADALFSSLEESHPVTTAIGGALPSMAIPGGKLIQMGVGAAEGALMDPESPISGAAKGAAFSLVGQKLGDELSQAVAGRINKFRDTASSRAQQEAVEQLSRIETNPLRQSTTIAERGAGSLNTSIARQAEKAADTALGGTAIATRRQSNLNRQFAKAIGENEDALTGPVMGQASKRIGEVYERAAEVVDNIPITQEFSDRLGRLTVEAEEIGDLPARALNQLTKIENLTLGDDLSGAVYKTTRTKLGQISRQLWNQGDDLGATWVDDLMTSMDDAFAAAAPPGLVDEIGVAGQQWRVLTAARRGAAVDPAGNVNPNSMQNQLERSFRTLDRGSFADGAIGSAQRSNVAAQRFPPTPDSGTAGRNASLNPATLAKAGILNLGGGAGAAAGGNLAREAGLDLTTPTQTEQ